MNKKEKAARDQHAREAFLTKPTSVKRVTALYREIVDRVTVMWNHRFHAEAWMTRPNHALDQKTPAEMLGTEGGAERVFAMLDALKDKKPVERKPAPTEKE